MTKRRASRMDIIGQNGNDGLHYEVGATPKGEECIDDLRKEISALKSRVNDLQQTWQDISTAPKDTIILLFPDYNNNDPVVGQIWSCNTCDHINDLDGRGVKATHWMPIPEFKEK